jgi:hypothetical protein
MNMKNFGQATLLLARIETVALQNCKPKISYLLIDVRSIDICALSVNKKRPSHI